jgi:hypothetical protein
MKARVFCDDEGHCELLKTEAPLVEVWADAYIRHDRRPDWQERLRTDIRSLCDQFKPSIGQVLHATFVGDKPLQADIENLTLYDISTFNAAGRNGIRFEHGVVIPKAPSGHPYPYYYRYELNARSSSFGDWRTERVLASFDWTDLGAFVGEKRLAQVWLALVRGRLHTNPSHYPLAPKTPFALKVWIRPPFGAFESGANR